MKKYVKLLIAVLFFCISLNVRAKSYTEEEYKKLNIGRSYIVCNYVFDLSSYNPTLKDFLLASQSCPNNKVTIYEIKYAKDIKGKLTSSYTEVLTNTKLTSFPTLDLKYIEKGSVESRSNETVLDGTPNNNTYNLDKVTVNVSKYESLDLKRTYIVGSYIFDVSSHNPTLTDLMLASQTGTKGEATIYEIKYAEDINGNAQTSYREILDNKNLTNFPYLQERYVYYDEVKPTQPDSEAKIDLLNNTNPGEVSGIKLSETDISLKLGEEVTVTAEPLPIGAANGDFSWISGDNDIVSVDNGKIVAKTSGKTTVTVKASNGTSVIIDVEVIDTNKSATIICEDKVYNGTPQQIAVCSGGTVENNIQTLGGNYQITCSGDDTHQDATPETCKILRTETTTSLSPKTTIYSGDVQPMTGATSIYNSTNTAIENTQYTYKYYTDSSCTKGETTNAPIDAGTYYVTATLKIHTDYNPSTSSCVKYVVEKLDNTFTIVPQERDYNGYGLDAVADMTYSKTNGFNLKVNFTYYTDSACTKKTTTDMSVNNIEGAAPIAAGSYYVRAESEGNNNYNPVVITCTEEPVVVINKVNAVCPDITSYEGDYDGENHRFTVNKEAIGGTAKYCTEDCDDEANWSTELPPRQIGGTTTVNIKVVPDNSHNAVTCDAKTILINKIKNDIVVTPREEAYTSERIEVNATAHEYTIDPTTDVEYYLDEYCSGEVVEPIDVGRYYVKISTPETTNYAPTVTTDYMESERKCPLGIEIVKTDTTTTLPETSKVYNGQEQPLDTATSKFNSNNKNISDSTNIPKDTPSYTYVYYRDASCDELIENEFAPTNVGTYYAKASLEEKSNYKGSNSGCVKYTITKAEDTINLQSFEIPYDEDNPSGEPVVATPSTSVHGYNVEYTYFTEDGCDLSKKTTTEDGATEIGGAPTKAGKYYVSATTKNDPRNTNYNIAEIECAYAFEITKVNSVITCNKIVEGNTQSNLRYNSSPQNLAECNGGEFEIDANTNSNIIQKTDAGSYSLTCNGDRNHNTTTETCVIDKADTTTVVDGNDANLLNQITRDYKAGTRQGVNVETDHVYSKLNNKPEVTFTGTYNYEYFQTAANNDMGCSGTSLGSVAPIDASSGNTKYYVKVTLTGADNYNSSNVCVPFIINKIYATITVNYRDNLAYTGSVEEASATSTSGSAISFKYYTDVTCDTATTPNDNGSDTVYGAPRNAGNYYVRATSAETNNYHATTTDCRPALSIKSTYATCPEVTSYNGVYDGDTHTVTVGDTTDIGGVLLYKVDSGESSTNGEWVRTAPTRTNAGTSVLHIKVEGDSTHLTKTCDDKEIVLDKKVDVITINPDTVEPHVVEVTYDGLHHEATAIAESGSHITVQYFLDSNCSNPIAETPINYGSYYMRATSAGNDNYYSNDKCALAVKINKKDSTCPSNLASTIVPYDGNSHMITASGSYEGGTLEFMKTGGSWSTTNPSITHVSESTQVSVRIHNTDNNYNDANCGTYELRVDKINPVITCTNPTYTGSSLNTATCAGGTMADNMQTNAGSYTVTCNGDGDHLNLSSTCNINKSDTTTSIPEQNKTYNGNQQEANGASSNLSSTNTNISGAQYTYSYFLDNACHEVTTTPKYGGTYYVVATLTATSNYNSSQSPCTRYIMNQDKPKVVITCIPRTYNGSVQTIASCSTGGTLVESTANRTNAGSYEVYCMGDDEHSNADPVTCTINKAAPTCPAVSSVTATYDEHEHYLAGNPEATGGTAEYKLSRCQDENHVTGNNGTQCTPDWTSTFRPFTAVTLRGTTYIYVRVKGDENHNDNDNCGTYSITLN